MEIGLASDSGVVDRMVVTHESPELVFDERGGPERSKLEDWVVPRFSRRELMTGRYPI